MGCGIKFSSDNVLFTSLSAWGMHLHKSSSDRDVPSGDTSPNRVVQEAAIAHERKPAPPSRVSNSRVRLLREHAASTPLALPLAVSCNISSRFWLPLKPP